MNAPRVSTGHPTLCPVDISLKLVGDRWSMLIMRELFDGVSHFDAIQTQTGASPQILSARLKILEAGGILARTPYCERPMRFEYLLTEKGEAFFPVLFALRIWGERWCKPRGAVAAVDHSHRTCGVGVTVELYCPHCDQAARQQDVIAHPSGAWTQERTGKLARAKSRSNG